MCFQTTTFLLEIVLTQILIKLDSIELSCAQNVIYWDNSLRFAFSHRAETAAAIAAASHTLKTLSIKVNNLFYNQKCFHLPSFVCSFYRWFA